MLTAQRLILSILTVGLCATLASAAEKPQDKPTSIKDWGNVIDPDGDCTITEKKGVVSVTVPQTLHNLNPAIASNAPRVLREVEGDFAITVKVTGDFKPGDNPTKPQGSPFVGAGLLIWQNQDNCIRLERNCWYVKDSQTYACYTPLLEYYKNGVDQHTNPGSTTKEFFKGRSTWLQLSRRGDKVLASYSHDGKQWTTSKQIDATLPRKVQVGVSAVNSSDRPFTVEFEEFKVVPLK